MSHIAIKDTSTYKLKIEFLILNQKRYLNVDLNEFIKNKTDISDLNELKEIIKQKDYKIKLLEEELNKYKAKDKSKD